MKVRAPMTPQTQTEQPKRKRGALLAEAEQSSDFLVLYWLHELRQFPAPLSAGDRKKYMRLFGKIRLALQGDQMREAHRFHYTLTREQRCEYQRRYRRENKEAALATHYRSVRKKISQYRKYRVEYVKRRRSNDLNFRIKTNMYIRLRKAVKSQSALKLGRFRDFLGCTAAQLRAHLESKFRPGMSWGNYGEWHIDHIRPCASFDLTSPEQQAACFHFTNLQPLWAMENNLKRAKW